MEEDENTEEEVNPIIQEVSGGTTLPTRTKTVKMEVRTWDTLKSLKKENETFNDVIKDLLNERTKSVEKGNIKAIKYQRKNLFMETRYDYNNIGVEFEYNDVQNQQHEFTLDLKIRKVFAGKRVINPSEFFGLDSQHKHFHFVYLNIYLKCIAIALKKEFRVTAHMISDSDFEDIARWRKIYYDYNLSDDSFNMDIEDPMRLSEEEQPEEEYIKSMKESISASIWEFKK